MKEFVSAVKDSLVEEGGDTAEEPYVEFKLDGRTLRAYQPTPGQLTFMLAAMGRGQTTDQRFAAIINILMESLSEDDKDYLESRLLTRDPARRLSLDTVNDIFEHLTEEWFARPTQPSSDSAGSPPNDGA